jgi:acyl-CoA thioester hydrolase
MTITKEEYQRLTTTEVHVTYADTDVSGAVYHGKYFDYAEKARAKIVKHLLKALKGENQSWAISKAEVHYKKPARFDENIIVKTKVKEVRNASLIFEHHFFVEDIEIVRIEVLLVSIDGNLKLTKIEPHVLKKIKEFAGYS